jgi:uncharacterized membrane protein
MRLAIAYIAAGVVFLALDLTWLGVIARDYYRREMGDLLAQPFRMGPAVGFYLLYLVGVVYFAIQPALASGRWSDALLPGALFGLIAYATYDLTAMAVVRGWPTTLSYVDMAWGATLTAAAAAAGALVALRFG